MDLPALGCALLLDKLVFDHILILSVVWGLARILLYC